MSEIILMDDETNERREEVAKLIMAGKKPLAVARQLQIKVVEVNNYWSQWQEIARSETNQELAEDFLHRMVSHFDELISELYDNLENLKALSFGEKISAQINTTVNSIKDLEAKRLDALQKAGLLDGADLGDELAKREEREEMLLKILREDLCPACQAVVRDRITAMTKVVEGTVVDG